MQPRRLLWLPVIFLVVTFLQVAPLRFIDNALRNRGSARVTPLAYCFCTMQ